MMRSYPYDDAGLQAALLALSQRGVEVAEVTVSVGGNVVRRYQVPTALSVPAVEASGFDELPISDIAGIVARRLPLAATEGDGAVEDEAASASASSSEPTTGASLPNKGIILIDGDAGSGKTTFAHALADALPASAAVVSVDDISWYHDLLNWTDELIDGVITPWRSGGAVSYRPPGWVAKERPGAVMVPPDTRYLIVEGMAAVRPELERLGALPIFVSSDPSLALERVVGRDLSLGVNGGTRASVYGFHAGFQDAVVPFILEQEPWSRAALLVDGTATTPPGQFAIIEQR